MKLTLKTGVFLVLGVIVVAVGTFVVADMLFGKRNVQMTEVAAEWQARSPKFMAVLQENFPDDYDNLMQRSQTLMIEGAKPDELSSALLEASQAIADKYAQLSRQTPDDALRDWIGEVAASIQAIYLKGGADLCGSFIDSGPEALLGSAIRPELKGVLDARDAALFGALAAARDEGIAAVAPASDSDWAALDVEMSKDDVPASYAEALADGDTGKPDYCPGLVLLFDKIQVLPGDAGHRIRAEYLMNSFG